MSGEQPTVVLADDHPAIRLGVRMALLAGGLRVLAEAADGDGAVKAVLRETPDVCLLDICMPGGGIQAAAAIATLVPATAIVMLTASDSTEHLLASLRAGAVGYLPKDMPPDRLPAALRGVLSGETALPRALVGPVIGKLRELPSGAGGVLRAGALGLTGREDEIMRSLRAAHRRYRTHALALPDNRSPPHLHRHRQARRGRSQRGHPRAHPIGLSACR